MRKTLIQARISLGCVALPEVNLLTLNNGSTGCGKVLWLRVGGVVSDGDSPSTDKNPKFELDYAGADITLITNGEFTSSSSLFGVDLSLCINCESVPRYKGSSSTGKHLGTLFWKKDCHQYLRWRTNSIDQ